MDITPQNQKKLEKLARVVTKGNVGVFEHLVELDEKLEKIEESIPALHSVMKSVQGEAGLDGLDGATGEKGEKGKDGVDGKNGKDGKDGKDGRDGVDGIDGRNGIDGKDGQNGSPDTAEDIRNKLELLADDERLDSKAIKGLDEAVQPNIDRAIEILDKRTQFLINKTATSSGGGGAWGTITGTLSNQTDLQSALDTKADTSSLAAVATSGDAGDLVGTLSVLHGGTGNTDDILSGNLLVGQGAGQPMAQLAPGTDGYVLTSNGGLIGWASSISGSASWGTINGTLSDQTDLQAALDAKQASLTLTTTGSSGAATLVGSTLNIPQYSGAGAAGITRSVNVISTNQSAGATALTDYTYYVSGATTLTLPTAVGNTNMYRVMRTGSSTVAIATTSAQTINGAASPLNLITQYASVDLQSDGSNWFIH